MKYESIVYVGCFRHLLNKITCVSKCYVMYWLFNGHRKQLSIETKLKNKNAKQTNRNEIWILNHLLRLVQNSKNKWKMKSSNVDEIWCFMV